MTVLFTLDFTAAGTPDFSELEGLQDGRYRDVNGNSYTAKQLSETAVTADSVVITLTESECDEHTVGDLVDILQGDAAAITVAYLTGEREEIQASGYTVTLPQDSNRRTYVRAGEINPLVGTDEHVPTYLPVLEPAGITAQVTAHAPHDTVIRAEQ